MKHRLIYSLLSGMAVLGAGITTVNASSAVAHVAGTHQGNSAYKFLTGNTPIALGDFSNPNAQFNIRGDYTAMSTALGNMPVDCSGKTGRFLVKEQNLPGAKNVVSLLGDDSLSSVDPKQLRDYLVIAAAYFRSTQGNPAESAAVTFSRGHIHGGGNTISFIELKQSFSKFCTQVLALQSSAQPVAYPASGVATPYQAAQAAGYPTAAPQYVAPASVYGQPAAASLYPASGAAIPYQPAQAAGYPTATSHAVPVSVPSSRRPFDIAAAVRAAAGYVQPAVTQPATPHAVPTGVYSQSPQAARYPVAYHQQGSLADSRDVIPVGSNSAQHPADTVQPAQTAGYPTFSGQMTPVSAYIPGVSDVTAGRTWTPDEIAALEAASAAPAPVYDMPHRQAAAAGYPQPPMPAAAQPAAVGRGYASSPSVAAYTLAVGPMRPGSEFTDLELSTAGAMLQGINPANMLVRLQTVFSLARAQALFDKIIEG